MMNDNDSVIINELWNIFSFYAINNNVISPSTMSLATFIKFAKDCQILNSPLVSSIIDEPSNSILLKPSQPTEPSTCYSSKSMEMKIMHIINMVQQNISIQKSAVSTNHKNKSINFSEFISILKYISNLIYPGTNAYRRLLLENVFLLSNRRCNAQFDFVKELSHVS